MVQNDKEYKQIVEKLMKGLNQMGFHGTVIGAVEVDANTLEELGLFREAFEGTVVEGAILEEGQDE